MSIIETEQEKAARERRNKRCAKSYHKRAAAKKARKAYCNNADTRIMRYFYEGMTPARIALMLKAPMSMVLEVIAEAEAAKKEAGV